MLWISARERLTLHPHFLVAVALARALSTHEEYDEVILELQAVVRRCQIISSRKTIG